MLFNAMAGSCAYPEREAGATKAVPASGMHRPEAYRASPSSNIFGLGVALAVHVSVLAAFLWMQYAMPSQRIAANQQAVVVHLAPLSVAPPSAPKPADAVPQQKRAAPERAATTNMEYTKALFPLHDAPRVSAPASTSNVLKPADDPDKVTASITALPLAPPAQAREPSASAQQKARVDWQSLLINHLARYRRYPRQAESMRQQGVVMVAITMDRWGGLEKVDLVRSSGFAALDAEGLATVRRASPLPPPTADIPGNPVIAQVPILFAIRQ